MLGHGWATASRMMSDRGQLLANAESTRVMDGPKEHEFCLHLQEVVSLERWAHTAGEAQQLPDHNTASKA